MKKLLLALFIAFAAPSFASEPIGEFLGIQFGASRDHVLDTIKARGSKLKSDKNPAILEFVGGSYAGHEITDLHLEFADDALCLATVSVKVTVDKDPQKGVDAYSQLRQSLTEKYGAPSVASTAARGKSFEEKAKAGKVVTAWQNKDALTGIQRSVELLIPGVGMYSWTLQVTYRDDTFKARQPKGGAPKKDI